AVKEAAAPVAATVADRFLSALGSAGSNGSKGSNGSNRSNGSNGNVLSNPIMRHPASGEMRTLALRRAQQGIGNYGTQRLVAQLQRSPVIQGECACGGTCEECQEKGSTPVEDTEKTGVVQRQAAIGADSGNTVSSDIIPSDSPGHPLDTGTRSFMESRFGTDFSEVRVHTDTRAAESADALAANAYTTGRDIYFAAGKYAPSSRDGQRLLAHELTHTVQQAESNQVLREAGVLRLSQPDEPMEREAEVVAGSVSQYPLAVARQADAGVPAGSGLEERAARPASKEVIRALEKPDPIA